MMDAFRGSKKLIGVVFAVLMFVFVLTGIDYSAFTGANNVGSINGESVDIRNFEAAVQQQVQAYQQQSPGTLSLEDVARIRDEVWDQFVQTAVLEEEYDRRDIEATDEEVVQALRSSPPPDLVQAPQFQTDGRFDFTKYQRWLTSSAAQPYIPLLESQAREQIRRTKLFRTVTGDIFLSDAALWQAYRDQNETVRIGLTPIIGRNIVPDSAVSATPAEVERYYREHQDEFARTRTAFMSYVALPRRITAADSAAALQHAQEVRAELAGGADFAEVAARESADSASAFNGGELGQFLRGQMVPPFDSAAFSLPLNTLSEPIMTQYGYHLVEVLSRQGDTASARHVLIPIDLAGARRDSFDARADTLDRIAAEQTDPTALDSVARQLGLPLGRALPLPEGSRAQVGRVVVPDAGVWAFQANEGELSPIIETANAYFVFRLDSIQPAGTPSLAEIRPAVTQAVLLEKKTAEARSIAERFLQRVEGGTPMAEAAEAMGLTYRELGPFNRISPPLPNPALVGAAFGLEPGRRSGVLDTEEGLYVLEVLQHTPADSAAFNASLDELRAEGIRVARQERVRSYLDALRKQADVEDRRAEVYRTQAQAQQQALPL
ncbi:MAG: SurA N-terminal domain-containing protein [Gemmatimonadota bacterium]|nr:SurA N-terminal domain-containing protein [Gemmatimonadota bacterium]